MIVKILLLHQSVLFPSNFHLFGWQILTYGFTKLNTTFYNCHYSWKDKVQIIASALAFSVTFQPPSQHVPLSCCWNSHTLLFTVSPSRYLHTVHPYYPRPLCVSLSHHYPTTTNNSFTQTYCHLTQGCRQEISFGGAIQIGVLIRKTFRSGGGRRGEGADWFLFAKQKEGVEGRYSPLPFTVHSYLTSIL